VPQTLAFIATIVSLLALLPLLVLTALVVSLAFRAKRAARHSIFTRRATAQQALGQFWDSQIVTLRDIA
jgi:ABC-type proline/glycine betaine transport system permease subunit